MIVSQIQESTLDFLKHLADNNNRIWFEAKKERFLAAQQNMIAFADHLLFLLNTHDFIENESGKKSLYRIYSDVRFKKDKSPYNARFALGLRRATKMRRGGYYLHIQPGNSFLACGFFSPNKEDLLRIRKDIEINYEDWKEILEMESIKSNFGSLSGETLSTAPRGFSKEHTGIDLIRHKQFIWRHDFSDLEVIQPDFVEKVNEGFTNIRPFFDYMSLVLTTDLNGKSLV